MGITNCKFRGQLAILQKLSYERKYDIFFKKIITSLSKRQYYITKLLAKGDFGIVISAVNSINQNMAIKIQFLLLEGNTLLSRNMGNSAQLIKEKRQRFENEVIMMNKINHINVVKCIDSFWDGDFFFIIMKESKMNLNQFCKQNKSFTTSQLLNYWDQLIKGMESIHDQGLIMKNIKPDNLLINQEDQIEYCGFDLTEDQNSENFITSSSSYEIQGNKFHHPPEIINIFLQLSNYNDMIDFCRKNNIRQDQSGDVWALGIVMLYLLRVKSFDIQGFSYFRKEFKFPIEQEDLYSFAFYILQWDKQNRPTIKEIKEKFTQLYLKHVMNNKPDQMINSIIPQQNEVEDQDIIRLTF